VNSPPPSPTQPATPNLMLRGWREAQGMTRAEMADVLNNTPAGRLYVLNCTTSLIASWESGRIRCPSTRYQRALHNLTGRDPAALGFTTPAGQPSPASPPPGQATTHLLDQLTTQATARGLAIYEPWPPGEPYEISFINPASPELGQAIIDCCGLLSWERHCRLTPTDIPAITTTMTTLLSEDFNQHLTPQPPSTELPGGTPADEFYDYLSHALTDPPFRAAYQDTQTRTLLLQHLTALRTKLGLTQAQAAQRMHEPESLITELEDSSTDPHLSTLQRYARALGTRLDITLTSPPPPTQDNPATTPTPPHQDTP
jgi:transcriptional regulator with XRE-family HTH domain